MLCMDYSAFQRFQNIIKTNGFASNYFSVSRSAQQECPIAPILYIIQVEPMVCTIRPDPEIGGIKLPDESSVIENKISIFAGDDTQLMNRNSFKMLYICE